MPCAFVESLKLLLSPQDVWPMDCQSLHETVLLIKPHGQGSALWQMRSREPQPLSFLQVLYFLCISTAENQPVYKKKNVRGYLFEEKSHQQYHAA